MCLVCFFLNLFRNFGYFWADDRADPNEPCSQNYHGEAEFSEPESRAIRVKFVNQSNVTFSNLSFNLFCTDYQFANALDAWLMSA